MDRLTHRELEVTGLIAEGLSNKQIANKLFISVHTVKTILENVFTKLDIHNRVLLAVMYVEYTKLIL